MSGRPWYSCIMTTATNDLIAQARLYVDRYGVGPDRIRPLTEQPTPEDFDERLKQTKAWMDARLSFHYSDALAEAEDAFRSATEAAELLEPEPVTFEPNRVLAKAARIIERRGWHQGSWEANPGGAVCAMKAIELAADCDGRAYSDAVAELMNRIAIDTKDYLSVPSWNDSPGRTREDVVRLLY